MHWFLVYFVCLGVFWQFGSCFIKGLSVFGCQDWFINFLLKCSKSSPKQFIAAGYWSDQTRRVSTQFAICTFVGTSLSSSSDSCTFKFTFLAQFQVLWSLHSRVSHNVICTLTCSYWSCDLKWPRMTRNVQRWTLWTVIFTDFRGRWVYIWILKYFTI